MYSQRKVTRALTNERFVIIKNVVPSKLYIRAEDEYGQPIEIRWQYQDTVMVMPQVGERWLVTLKGSDWVLVKRLETYVGTSMSPGDVKIDAKSTLYLDAGQRIKIGSGGNQQIYTSSDARKLWIADGSEDAPITDNLGPTLKVTRTEQYTKAQTAEAAGNPSTDGFEYLSAIAGVNVAAEDSEVQPIGVLGAAKTNSSIVSVGFNDACGIYGIGRVTSAGTGVGIGGFFHGRTDSTTGKATGTEVHVSNYSGVDKTYSSTGFSGSQALWINCSGTADSASAITVSNAFGRQFEIGLAFTAQVTGGKTGGVKTTSIQDDSSSTNSILIKGTHTIGIGIAAGGGPIVIGATALSATTSQLLEIYKTSFADPIIKVGGAGGGHSILLYNGNASGYWWISNGADNFLTGSASGDVGFSVTASKKMMFGDRTSRVLLTLKTTSTPEIGFFSASTAAKQTVSGSRGANAALESLLTALAAYGLITDSTSA